MILTNGEIRNYLINYMNADKTDVEIPFSTMYKIRKNIQKLEVEEGPIEETIRDIVKKYGTDEKNPKLNEELRKLSLVENEVDIEKIPVSAFEDVKVAPKFVDAIFFMLND